MINVLEDMDKCVGCGSCSSDKKCIEMIPDEEGFLYPKIESNLCSNCGFCRTVCPVESKKISSISNSISNKSFFYGWSKDNNIRLDSTSGGMFSEFAKYFLDKGAYVFGAVFDKKYKVYHTYIDKFSEIDRLRRSKYVQSDTNDSFLRVKDFLKKEEKVLFAGTPCQVAGLKSFLGDEYENLFLIDFVCFGVPSPKIWSLYVEYLKNEYNSEIEKVNFRNKDKGWTDNKMKIVFKNGLKYIVPTRENPYFIGFGKRLFNRKCCSKCNFKIYNSKADITLGDFWGYEKLEAKDESYQKGVSLIITNTQEGNKVLKSLENIYIKETSQEFTLKYNPFLVNYNMHSKKREEFFKYVKDGVGFGKLKKKYMNNTGLKYNLKKTIRSIMVKAGIKN